MSSQVSTGGGNGPLSGGGLFTIEPVQAGAYTALAGDFVPVDATAGAVTVTLPAAPQDGTMVAVKMIATASSHAVTVAAGGADTFNKQGGATSLTLSLLNQGAIVQYKASIAVWYVLGDDLAAGTLGATTFSGLATLNAGSDTAGSAPVLTALGATSGTATQLSDLTRDYVVYLEVTTAGTATSLTMGHTNSANDVTIMASAAATAGQVISFRLPAGWWFKWTGTTTAMANQVAVGC